MKLMHRCNLYSGVETCFFFQVHYHNLWNLTVFVFKQAKTCQPVGPRSLFRAFIFRCQEGIIAIYILQTSFGDMADQAF